MSFSGRAAPYPAWRTPPRRAPAERARPALSSRARAHPSCVRRHNFRRALGRPDHRIGINVGSPAKGVIVPATAHAAGGAGSVPDVAVRPLDHLCPSDGAGRLAGSARLIFTGAVPTRYSRPQFEPQFRPGSSGSTIALERLQRVDCGQSDQQESAQSAPAWQGQFHEIARIRINGLLVLGEARNTL